jgi:hypothetical protein
MKVALCFIISYDHILNKEHIWREWIDANKELINVYFYYKDYRKIKSEWIREHTIPPDYIYPTSYLQVVPAYLSLMTFAFKHDKENEWFCFLTDSCCPIVSPDKFKSVFEEYHAKSIMSWAKSSWNIQYHKRANLAKLPKDLHLANAPWFILTREHVQLTLYYDTEKRDIVNLICAGGLANESLFAIILKACGKLQEVINCPTHLTDWNRRSSSSSPHLFKYGDKQDVEFIERNLKENNCGIFIRKIDYFVRVIFDK